MSVVVLFLIFVLLIALAMNVKPMVRNCYSVSCKHNFRGKCCLKQIDIYDNKVLGLCLWHTSIMQERILDPFNKGREIGIKDGEISCIDKLAKAIDNDRDQKAIQNPEEFKKWMKKHGITDQK